MADSYVKANAHNCNFGLQPALRVSAKDEALLGFNLASIPTGAVVRSANLKLYINGENGVDQIEVHRIVSPWDEGAVTYRSFGQRYSYDVSGALCVESRTAQKTLGVKS